MPGASSGVSSAAAEPKIPSASSGTPSTEAESAAPSASSGTSTAAPKPSAPRPQSDDVLDLGAASRAAVLKRVAPVAAAMALLIVWLGIRRRRG